MLLCTFAKCTEAMNFSPCLAENQQRLAWITEEVLLARHFCIKPTAPYRNADKSLARPGRKEARKHVRDARDFNNIETRAVIKFPPPPGKAPKGIPTILTETLAYFLPGRAKDLSSTPVHAVHTVRWSHGITENTYCPYYPTCVVGQLSSRIHHHVLAVAALDKSLSMLWWRWHINVSQLCCCWSMAVSFWVASTTVWACCGVPPRECRLELEQRSS